jgi:hypothetical protein
VKPRREPAAPDQAGAADSHVEIADDPPPGQRARPFLERIEFAGGATAADQCANRGADNDIGINAGGFECVDDADMRKAACRSAAENQADQRLAAIDPDRIAIDGFCFNGIGSNGSGINCWRFNLDNTPLILASCAIALASIHATGPRSGRSQG